MSTKKLSTNDIHQLLKDYTEDLSEFVRKAVFTPNPSNFGRRLLFPAPSTVSGRFSSAGPNGANLPKPNPNTTLTVSGPLKGQITVHKTVISRNAIKRALYGRAYGASTSTLADLVLIPPEGTNPGYQDVCMSGCTQQLRCAMGPPHLPLVCGHCRGLSSFHHKLSPYLDAPIGRFGLGEVKVSWEEREQLHRDLCDPADTVPSACPLFQHAVVTCPRCAHEGRGRGNPVRAIHEQVSCWGKKRKPHYIYGGPDTPRTTFKGWVMRCTDRNHRTLHDREQQRHARRTEKEKLHENAKQQQTNRRLSRRSRSRKKAKR